MKKCPICETAGPKKEDACGVCGMTLAEVNAESIVTPSLEHPRPVQYFLRDATTDEPKAV